MKKLMNRIKQIKFVLKYGRYILMLVPLLFIPIFNSLLMYTINYNVKAFFVPILFDICYIFLIFGLSVSFKEKIGKIIYIVLTSFWLFIFLLNNIYFSMTETVFDYVLLGSAKEGSGYFLDTILNCNPFVYICFIVLVINVIVAVKFFPKNKKNNYKYIVGVLIIFTLVHAITPLLLGKANKSLKWSSWKNERNIYNNFNDSNKCLRIAGFYEYNIRNFYVNYLKPSVKITKEELDFLNEAYKEEKNTTNSYTGIFKDKNLIIIQLEGLDSWIVSKEHTPNIYRLMNEGINFNNHYSYYNGGGSTFNSEFAINTGFITPLSYTKNAYTFNKNNFKYSLANIFKNDGYKVNAFHMNTGEFYSRTINYKNWGYDNYYGLADMYDYTDDKYELDTELINNTEFSDLMMEDKFVDYIITYSGHLPFSSSKGVCKMLLDMDGDETVHTEEECVYRQAKETDDFIGLLLDKLEANNKLDNTAILVVTDHYLYTISDKTILDKYKNTSNNLINRTPMFIWSKGIKHNDVYKVTSQLNILPTILNMYGYEYSKNNYIGEDIFDPNYKGIVFFSDYSWYDGKTYYDSTVTTMNDSINTNNEYISYITKKNDLALKYDYFKKK